MPGDPLINLINNKEFVKEYRRINMQDNKCASCKYYESSLCKLYPPKAFVFYGDIVGVLEEVRRYPQVYSSDWCGQWEKKE